MIRSVLTVFRSTLGAGTLPVVLSVAIAAGASLMFNKGAEHERAQCHAANLEADIAAKNAALEQLKRQLYAANKIRADTLHRLARDDEIHRQTLEEANAYIQSLSSRDDLCILSPDDADQLRRIGR